MIAVFLTDQKTAQYHDIMKRKENLENLNLPFRALYDEYIDRPKLSEQTNPLYNY